MSAARTGHPQRRRYGIGRRAIRPSKAVKTGTMIAALSLAVAIPAQSEDGLRKSGQQVASVSGGQDVLPFRLGMPPRPYLGDIDLKVLLVQNRATTKTDATADEDTILVALSLSVPQTVDDDIAKQHDLELLERTELPDLGLRIVQFRASANRPTGPILVELRNDQRIHRAQLNAQYGRPSQGAPAVSRLNGPPVVEPQPTETVQRQPDRKAPAVAKIVQTSNPETSAVKAARSLNGANESAVAPIRVGKVGDVLSGGL